MDRINLINNYNWINQKLLSIWREVKMTANVLTWCSTFEYKIRKCKSATHPTSVLHDGDGGAIICRVKFWNILVDEITLLMLHSLPLMIPFNLLIIKEQSRGFRICLTNNPISFCSQICTHILNLQWRMRGTIVLIVPLTLAHFYEVVADHNLVTCKTLNNLTSIAPCLCGYNLTNVLASEKMSLTPLQCRYQIHVLFLFCIFSIV